MLQEALDDVVIKTIRDEVKSGRIKIQVANDLGISYYLVKKHTKDIPTILSIPKQLQQRIQEEIKKGKSIRQIAEELNVSRDTVIKYTREIPKKPNKNRKRSTGQIAQIRKYVLKYNSKSEAARKLGLSYSIIRWYTKDIKMDNKLSEEKIKKIREKVINGTPKKQVARELNVSWTAVAKYTADIPQHLYYKPHSKGGSPAIRGRTLKILKKLLIDGYYIFSRQGDIGLYHTLRKHFPTICKVRMCRKTIIFLEDKSDIAIMAYLKSLDKRITNYYELKQVIKAFKTNMTSEEKKKYIHKKKSIRQGFCNKNQ